MTDAERDAAARERHAPTDLAGGRRVRTNCGACGLHLGNNIYSCNGFTDGYDQYACRCRCHEKARA